MIKYFLQNHFFSPKSSLSLNMRANNGEVDRNSIRFEECINSSYIAPKRMIYTENGKQKSWDIIKSHNSVSILLYHQDLESFIIVRQFRPAVFAQNGDGYSYELCAGLVDKKDKDIQTIASEEILEECGYQVQPECLEKIGSFYSSTGISGSKQTIFFTTLSHENKVNEGGGIDDENIAVLYLRLKTAQAFIQDDVLAKTTGLAYSIRWYFDRIAQGVKN